MYLTYLVPHLHVNRPLIELNQCIEPCVSCFFFVFCFPHLLCEI